MRDPFSRQAVRTGLFYRDPLVALEWIERAFGFTRLIDMRDAQGRLVHAEMAYGDASIIVDAEWSDFVASPVSVDGKNTQLIYVQIAECIDSHCEHARQNGATILQEPDDQFYGDRTYRARDPEGMSGHSLKLCVISAVGKPRN